MKEEILLSARWRGPLVLTTAILIAVGIGAIVFGSNREDMVYLILVGLVVLPFGLWMLCRVISCMVRTGLKITTHKVVATPKFRSPQRLDHGKVTSIHASHGRTLFGFLLGYGDVTVEAQGISAIVIPFVAWPCSFCKRASQAIAEVQQSHSSGVEGGVSVEETSSNGPEPDKAEYFSEAELERHKLFFGSLGSSVGTPMAEPPTTDFELVCICERDASYEAPKRSDMDASPPNLVSWNPRGDQFVTACDAHGMTRWTSDGRRIGGESKNPGFGDAIRLLWSRDGRYALLYGQTTLTKVWTVQDASGSVMSYVEAHGHFGYAPSNRYNIDVGTACSPWRPGARHLAMVRCDGVLEVYDLADFPPEERNPVSRIVFSSKNKRQASRIKTLHDASPVHALDFRSFGGLCRQISRFAWHPSGQYVAVTCEAQEDNHARQTHVVHVDSARVLVSAPVGHMLLGWNPGGDLLVLEGRARSNHLSVWDSTRWEFRLLAAEERETTWGRRVSKFDKPLNADGTRELRRRSPNPDGYSALSVVTHTGDDEHSVDLPNSIVPWGAAWSPTDPDLFATVSGNDSPRSLRLWRIR